MPKTVVLIDLGDAASQRTSRRRRLSTWVVSGAPAHHDRPTAQATRAARNPDVCRAGPYASRGHS